MPRRHVFQHVEHSRGTRPSARALDRALIAAGYDGPSISWGRHGSNKRLQLERMRSAGVSIPLLMTPHEANSLLDEQGGLPEWDGCMQVIGRTDHHRAGSGLWYCTTKFQVNDAVRAGATHFLQYLWPAREFRCHVVDGLSIKLTEKTRNLRAGEAGAVTHPVIRSHENGWMQMYPGLGAHRVSLRATARAAVEALGLRLGAVDLLLYQDAFYVLEVNSAPALTDPNTDTLERYVRALMRS